MPWKNDYPEIADYKVGLFAPNMAFHVYALIDPETKEIRYVGVTRNIIARYARHLTETKESTPKNKWIKDLLAKNKRPEFKVIETITYSDGHRNRLAVETKWINYYRSDGANLFN